MLPAAHRMRDGEAFRSTIRRGAKAVQADLVVHLNDATTPTDKTSVGFVVSKAVGNAVVRNRVKRQLRHAMVMPLQGIAAGHHVVIRAFPSAAGQSFERLADEVSDGLVAAQGKLRR